MYLLTHDHPVAIDYTYIKVCSVLFWFRVLRLSQSYYRIFRPLEYSSGLFDLITRSGIILHLSKTLNFECLTTDQDKTEKLGIPTRYLIRYFLTLTSSSDVKSTWLLSYL